MTEPNTPGMPPEQPLPGEEPLMAASSPGGGGDSLDEAAAVTALEAQLAERTADLQRLQAEYVNYKRRVDRDRDLVRDHAVAAALTALLPVLDDIDRARAHGELTGGFKAVSESLERTVTSLGLSRFGTAGEPFDPRIHEALMSEPSAEVDGPTAQTILQPGYRVGERVVRPARVAVAEPISTAVAPTVDEAVDEAEPIVEAELGEEPRRRDRGVPVVDEDDVDGRVGGGVHGRSPSAGT